MKLEHSFTVPTGVDEAWQILLDIRRIGPCMPGAAIDSVDGDDFTGTVKVKLGPIGLTYKGKASFVEKDEAVHRAVIDARGRDSRGNGTAAAKVTATLTDQGGSTLVSVDTDLDITGKPAQFGRGVMVDVGNKLIGQFADNLADTIRGDSPEAPQAAATAPATRPATKRSARPKPPRATATGAGATPTSGAGGSDTTTSEDTTPEGATPAPPTAESAATAGPIEQAAVEAVADATAAYSAPASSSAPGGEVNGHRTEPVREVEPINLIESAGPAVAKRLAPVALVLIILFVVLRLRRKH